LWGIWNGIKPARRLQATRRVAATERGVAPFLGEPGVGAALRHAQLWRVSSRWPLGHETVWTIVNRAGYDIDGRQMDVPLAPGMRYFDLYHGVELKPETDGPVAVLSFDLEANGYGAILATSRRAQ